jgi:hypothetical protein
MHLLLTEQRQTLGPGRTPAIPAATVAEVIRLSTQEKPHNATHWRTRSMAAVGISDSSAADLASPGLKPHRLKTFKLSNDSQFAEKLEAVVRLYVNPPDNAMVFCVG